MVTESEQRVLDRLQEMVELIASRYGVELIELTYHRSKSQIVRVVVDKAGGVTVDDCAAVSRRLSADLDISELIPGHYTLEVSSPGLDRPLRAPADFRRKVGEKITLRYSDSDGKRRTVTGAIDMVNEGGVTLSGTVYLWEHIVEGKLVI